MSCQFPVWLERLFLFFDEWFYLVGALFLLFKWIRLKMGVILYRNAGASNHRDAAVFSERAHLIVTLVWIIVGAIFVYCVGYTLFFKHSGVLP